MLRAAVGLYCAVVDRFNPLGLRYTSAARETQLVLNQRAESLRTELCALNLRSVHWRAGNANLKAAPCGR